MKVAFRRRIQRVAMIVAFLTVVGYAIPTLFFTIDSLRDGAQRQVAAEALSTATHLQMRLAEGQKIDALYLKQIATHDFYIEVQLYEQIIKYGDEATAGISASSEIGPVRVTIVNNNVDLQNAIQRLLLSTAIYGLIAAAGAWIIARELAIRFEKPIQDLVDAAVRIEAGDRRAASQRYGVLELDNVAQVLDSVSNRMQQLLLVERQLTSEISHQLRTPLTALQLQIDEILISANDPEVVRLEAEKASRQISRITTAMQELVNARRGVENGPTTKLNLAVSPVVEDIKPRMRVSARPLEVDIPDHLETTAAPGAIRHLLSILLENAYLHGKGRVSVTAIPNAEWVILRVQDEGPGLEKNIGEAINDLQRQLSADRKPNIGIPLAVALTVGVGGRIEWKATEPSVVQVYLPTAN